MLFHSSTAITSIECAQTLKFYLQIYYHLTCLSAILICQVLFLKFCPIFKFIIQNLNDLKITHHFQVQQRQFLIFSLITPIILVYSELIFANLPIVLLAMKPSFMFARVIVFCIISGRHDLRKVTYFSY